MIALAANIPEGPTSIDVISSSRKNPLPASNLSANAGNVTALNIVGNSITQTWQGYVGNVSGTITLADSNNFTLYNWSLSNPSGEIFASTTLLDFSDGNIECYNYTKSGGGYLDLVSAETALGLLSKDADGINETFISGTAHDTFYAGTNLIDGECPETQLYNGTGAKSEAQFQEVLLYDLTANQIIYTAILEDTPQQGFNGENWDFEMIVGENGHVDNQPTTYYFYVELN